VTEVDSLGRSQASISTNRIIKQPITVVSSFKWALNVDLIAMRLRSSYPIFAGRAALCRWTGPKNPAAHFGDAFCVRHQPTSEDGVIFFNGLGISSLTALLIILSRIIDRRLKNLPGGDSSHSMLGFASKLPTRHQSKQLYYRVSQVPRGTARCVSRALGPEPEYGWIHLDLHGALITHSHSEQVWQPHDHVGRCGTFAANVKCAGFSDQFASLSARRE
jgi:hypothetical protein